MARPAGFEVASVIEPELEAATEEILDAIAREVPEYARPLEGCFGRGIRSGVSEALRQFVALIRDPDADRSAGPRGLSRAGRGELRQGRTLDSLQAAYRVGARVAWRRLGGRGAGGGPRPATLSLLAESIFAYIDQLAADSVEGYAEAMAELEDERPAAAAPSRALCCVTRRRARPTSRPRAGRTGRGRARWRRLPASRGGPRRLVPGGSGGRAGQHGRAELGCVVDPRPRGARAGRRADRRERDTGLTWSAVGPSCPLVELALVRRLARAALEARRAALRPRAREDHLGELLLCGRASRDREIATAATWARSTASARRARADGGDRPGLRPARRQRSGGRPRPPPPSAKRPPSASPAPRACSATSSTTRRRDSSWRRRCSTGAWARRPRARASRRRSRDAASCRRRPPARAGDRAGAAARPRTGDAAAGSRRSPLRPPRPRA